MGTLPSTEKYRRGSTFPITWSQSPWMLPKVLDPLSRPVSHMSDTSLVTPDTQEQPRWKKCSRASSPTAARWKRKREPVRTCQVITYRLTSGQISAVTIYKTWTMWIVWHLQIKIHGIFSSNSWVTTMQTHSSLLKRKPGNPSTISLKFYYALRSSDHYNWEECKTHKYIYKLLFLLVAVWLLAQKPSPGLSLFQCFTERRKVTKQELQRCLKEISGTWNHFWD